MGLFASFALHARDRNGAHRASDHGKAPPCRKRRRQWWAGTCLTAILFASAAKAERLRIAYFHSELSRDGPGLLLRDILKGDPQIDAWVRVVQAADADILVIGDVDFDMAGWAISALAEKLQDYPHHFTKRPNRGLPSGRDLDGDGRMGGPRDAEGYGMFSGQGGMAVLSRYPIIHDSVRDFSAFEWHSLPGHLGLRDGRDPTRLSTTVHWDLPIDLGDGNHLHVLLWHATAPVFDGPEDRNGRRNHDEARFWQHYLDGALPWSPPQNVILIGTANADPMDGESRSQALRALLAHPDLQDPRPSSEGAVARARSDGGANLRHKSNPAFDTVDWPDTTGGPGNLRVDYVLPSAQFAVAASGVFWPQPETSLGRDVALASRHRLVWVDIEMGNGAAHRH